MNDKQAVQYHRNKVVECDQKILQLQQARQYHADMINVIAPPVSLAALKKSLKLLDKLAGPEPTKFCKYHKKEHPLCNFLKDSHSPDGLYSICATAEKAKRKALYKAKDAKGECHKCKQPALPGKKLCVKHIKKSTPKKSKKS